MSDNFESAVESSRRTVSALGARAKEKLMEQVRQEPTRTFAIILAGSVLTAVLVGYYISRAEDKTRRKRLVEDSMREAANWIKVQLSDKTLWDMLHPSGIDSGRMTRTPEVKRADDRNATSGEEPTCPSPK